MSPKKIMLLPKNKRGVTGGLITGLVMGVAALVIVVIIALVITSTLSNAGLLTAGRSTNTIYNETGGYINASGYTLAYSGGNNLSYSIIRAWNETNLTGSAGSQIIILPGNYTVSATGVVTNATTTVWSTTDVNFTYSYQIKNAEELATQRLTGNFTAGIDNVSSKIPTVLLIAAIVLILGVLVFLVVQWQRMRLGGGAGSL